MFYVDEKVYDESLKDFKILKSTCFNEKSQAETAVLVLNAFNYDVNKI